MTDKIKTGTTCVGMKFKDGVALAADKRATTYKIETDGMTKLFNVSKYAVSTVAGEAASAQLFMRYLQSESKLLELKKERTVRISEIAAILNSMQYNALRSTGSVVASILGGYDDKEGISLYDLSPDGVISDHESYLSDGSGSLYTKSLLDTEYKENMSEKEVLELIKKCYKVAFKNDNASGGGYIVRIVTKDGIKEVENKIVKSEFVNK